MSVLRRFAIWEVVEGLRDYWSRTNKEDFLNDLFAGWDEDDPSEYYHNKWIVFRASPMQFWCGCSDDKRTLLHALIIKEIQRSRDYQDAQLMAIDDAKKDGHDYDEFSHNPF